MRYLEFFEQGGNSDIASRGGGRDDTYKTIKVTLLDLKVPPLGTALLLCSLDQQKIKSQDFSCCHNLRGANSL